MNNAVNRAPDVGAKKNNFSLLTHKGRWLLATLTLLFTMGIGQMWGAEGDETFTFSWTSAGTAGYSYAQAGPTGGVLLANNAVYFLSNEGPKVDASKLNPYRVGFVFKPTANVKLKIYATAGNSARTIQNIKIDEKIDARFYSLCKDAVGSSKTVMQYALDNASAADKTFWASVGILKNTTTVAGDAKSASGQTAQASLYDARVSANNISIAAKGSTEAILNTGTPAADYVFQAGKYYRVYTEVSSSTGSQVVSFTFVPAPTTTHTLTWNFDGGSSSATAGTDYTAGGDVAEGADITYPADETMSKTNKDFAGWSTSATTMPTTDLTITAQWVDHVAKYTVKYMDGSTVLDTEKVTVGQHPAGLASDPTKDCYTFAAWSPALNTVSGEENDVVEVNATWTPNYAFGAYSFVNVATVGTAPNKLTMTDGTAVNVAAGSRVDNFYFSAMAIKYESGASDALTDYKGWKINTKDATIKFLVENNSQVKIAIGRDNTAAVSYTALNGTAMNNVEQAKSTEVVYSVKAGTVFTLSMTTGSTITLKRISISNLYNATFTDETGDASGSASNVTEVTLPTPTETTVGTSTFTGWTANKIVYDGTTEKAVDDALEAGKTYKLTDNTTFTAQWLAVSDFDVKFFQGYGEPDVQIGTTQKISTGNYAEAPADPSRGGYNFKGWSYDATEEHIVNVAEYAITAATNFTAIWKQVFAVTFDDAGEVNVESGSKVASPNSPSQAGKVFLGWYNGENKWNFADNVTEAMALTSKWEDADANHFYYNYKDAFHFDGFAYKTPEGKVDAGAGASNIAITTPYTLFSGAAGITSIVATGAIYDSKSNWVNAYLKLNTGEGSYLTFVIADGYTAVLKMKMGGYSANPTVTLKKGEDVVDAASGTIGGVASTENNYNEITYNLVAGTYTMTTATKTLYISHIDLEATIIPPHIVTYKAGEGSGDDVVDNDATQVMDCPNTFTAPEGKVFNGWKDALNNDVAVDATVESDMMLTAQWINQYAVTFNMQGHGTAVDPQYIKHGAKATKPTDPFVMGWEFGGWFKEAACQNEFDFNTAIEATTPLFAKWTQFTGCVESYPAKSGAAIAVGDPIVMQDGSHGAAMTALAIPDGGALNYTNSGLAFASKTGVKANVVLSNDIVAGTKIILTLVAGGDKTRGLFIYTKDGAKINDFTCWVDGVNPASNGLEDTFTYTVQAGDGLEGTNEFQLWRNNTVYLKSLKVSSCGDAIINHNLTSEVSIADKGTVTLGASTVREGHTTTAEYSDIDPLYEFVSWSISGEGASIESATANPVTVTMGTEDAVVTLNLQLKPVKFTVNYYEGTTLKGTEEVTVNEHPTAAGIETAKAHYIFEGWAESPTATAADVIDLATLTSAVTATFNLYAIYTHVPCVTEGTVFSMSITDEEGTEYMANNTFGEEIGATYVGGKAYSGSSSTSNRKGVINASEEYAFSANGEVAVKIAMDCALAEGDVIMFTNSNTRQLKIQKVVGTDLYTTENKKYTIPAASPLIGEYDFYLMRDNSGSTIKTLRVERPYTISFDLQGHGAAIAAVKQIKGEKIAAPAAPTADGWDFGGWYKEAACTNAWDFDNDVVATTATLFAKWSEHVYNDATLKSLTYGGEEIALEDGIYEYNINLPALTTAVPALDAETNSALATKLITNAAAFDGEGHATSTVKVTSEDLTVELTYTINFTKAAAVEQVDVTGTTEWNFSLAGNTSLQNQSDVVLANLPGITNDATFNSQALKGTFNKLQGDGHSYQGSVLQFHATVPGMLIVEYGGTNNHERKLQVIKKVGNDEIVEVEWAYNSSGDHLIDTVAVPAGDVILRAFEGTSANNARIYYMKFDTDFSNYELADNKLNGYERDVTEGRYGTICLPNGGVMVGATIYTLAFYGETSHKIFFDEVLNGTMEAGKPYLFLPNEGVNRIGVFYTDAKGESAKSINGFVGYIGANEEAYIPVPDGEGCYIVQNNQYREVLAGAEAYIRSYRAYIKFSEIGTTEPAKAPGVRRIGIGGEAPAVTTGVDALNIGEQPVKVLINGQIFILRGEKMYDATGRLVK